MYIALVPSYFDVFVVLVMSEDCMYFPVNNTDHLVFNAIILLRLLRYVSFHFRLFVCCWSLSPTIIQFLRISFIGQLECSTANETGNIFIWARGCFTDINV